MTRGREGEHLDDDGQSAPHTPAGQGDPSHGFEAKYAGDPDPFGVRTSWYERRKIGVVLAGLGRERYVAAWDAACGTGDLAAALASRCDSVLATDAAPTAVRLAAAHTRDLGVLVQQNALPHPPAGTHPGQFDLVMLSEVLYYLSDEDRRASAATALELLSPEPGAEVVAVHWRHHPHDAQLSGAAANEELDGWLRSAGLDRVAHHDDLDFVATYWARPGAPSRPGT